MEKIEIGYKLTVDLGVEFFHKYILYTDSNGNQYTISGFPTMEQTTLNTPLGNINVKADIPYNAENSDHPDSTTDNKERYFEPITEGEDLSNLWNKMIENARSKDDLYPYDTLRQNCNTLADSVLRDAGLPTPSLDEFGKNLAPGSDNPLDKNIIPFGIDPDKTYDWWANYFNGISDDVNSLWHAFKNWVAPRRDPLVLDLDGDGIETLAVNATTHVVFDYDGDGVKTGTGWIAGDEEVNCEARETTLGCGFVVLDRNGNGTIDNGGELFGDQTLVNGVKATDGFAALKGQDSNNNGKFDASDSNFTKVRIWQDTNADGISQAGELHTLNELGTPQGGLSCYAIHLLTSINLTSTTSNNQNFRNTRRVA